MDKSKPTRALCFLCLLQPADIQPSLSTFGRCMEKVCSFFNNLSRNKQKAQCPAAIEKIIVVFLMEKADSKKSSMQFFYCRASSQSWLYFQLLENAKWFEPLLLFCGNHCTRTWSVENNQGREYWYNTNSVKAEAPRDGVTSSWHINWQWNHYEALPLAFHCGSFTSDYNVPCKLSIPL